MNTLLDTNILTRLVQPDHAHHVVARDAVQLMLENGDNLCLVPPNLYEFWAVATRPASENGLGLPVESAQAEITQIRRLFTLLRDERGILAEWERLVRQHNVRGKTTHDARLVAAMHRHGLTRLLTFNADHFSRFSGITALTPSTVLQTIR